MPLSSSRVDCRVLEEPRHRVLRSFNRLSNRTVDPPIQRSADAKFLPKVADDATTSALNLV